MFTAIGIDKRTKNIGDSSERDGSKLVVDGYVLRKRTVRTLAHTPDA